MARKSHAAVALPRAEDPEAEPRTEAEWIARGGQYVVCGTYYRHSDGNWVESGEPYRVTTMARLEKMIEKGLVMRVHPLAGQPKAARG